ncbi:hypothetical protein OTU49_005491, partial [Cherax quadricarinatus]
SYLSICLLSYFPAATLFTPISAPLSTPTLYTPVCSFSFLHTPLPTLPLSSCASSFYSCSCFSFFFSSYSSSYPLFVFFPAAAAPPTPTPNPPPRTLRSPSHSTFLLFAFHFFFYS